MNLKDRLISIKATDDIEIKTTVDDANIADIFVDNEYVRGLVSDFSKKEKNIIFVSDRTIDKFLLAQYMQYLINDSKATIVNDIEENLIYINSRINIVPNPSISQIVKIFQYIIYGYKPFVFGLDLNSYDNVIEKVRALIAINFSNLNQENINTLISSSEAIFVSVSKNEDGLYFISKIDEITNFNGIPKLSNVFKHIDDASESDVILQEQVEEAFGDIAIEEDVQNELLEKIEEKVEVKPKVVLEEKAMSIDKNTKVNKYKLLKEKIKIRRNRV